MRRFARESGIAPLLRLFILLRLLWTSMLLVNLFIRPSIFPLEWFVFLSLGECLFLLIYLSIPQLQATLKNWYIPVALFIATFGPLIENFILQQAFPYIVIQVRGEGAMLDPDYNRLFNMISQLHLVFSLFIPLIFISWQYSLKIVIIYCLGLALMGSLPPLLLNGGQVPTGPVLLSVTLVPSLVFLLVGYIINRLSTEQKQQNAALAQANRQLSYHALALEELATSRERNRLAREIHDTLSHTLSGLAVNLEAMTALWQSNPAQAREILDQSLAVTRNGLIETRRTIQALRAGPLEELGLCLALEQLARSTAERDGLKLEMDITPNVDDLDPTVEQCIYRIAEEGLRNVSQHARATRITLSLIKQSDRIELILLDDGQGLNPANLGQPGHFGVHGMQERAAAVGGKLSIDNLPGSGVRLKLIMQGKGT